VADGEAVLRARLRVAEQAVGTRLPNAIRSLYAAADGRFRSDGEWWVVWPLEKLVKENKAAWLEGTLPADLVAFGDDGTGNPFCAPLDGTDKVVRWSWIDGDVVGSDGTVDDFLAQWTTW
jgi:hypothetical protein